MGVRIERLDPRCPGGEEPETTADGHYILVSPDIQAKLRNKIDYATFVQSLDEAADLIEKRGYSIRMVCDGKGASLISPRSLRVMRF